jgi:hypothetical protein
VPEKHHLNFRQKYLRKQLFLEPAKQRNPCVAYNTIKNKLAIICNNKLNIKYLSSVTQSEKL